MLKKRDLQSKLIWFLTILIIGFFSWRIFGMIKTNWDLGKKVEELKKEIANFKKENIELQRFIEKFKKESYLEKEAKERLNLRKPGEKVVIIVKEEIQEIKAETEKKFFDLSKIWQTIKENWKNLRE